MEDGGDTVEGNGRCWPLGADEALELIELSPNALIMRDAADGRLLWWNGAAADLYGLADDARGANTHALLGTVWPSGPDRAAATLRERGRWGGELRQRGAGGREVVVLSRQQLRHRDGTPAAVVLEANTDVTERRRRQRALADQARLLDLASDAVLVRDPDTDRVTSWRTGAERLYGYPEAEALGAVARELLRTTFPEDAQSVRAALERDGRWQGELRNRAADGRELVVLSRQILQRGVPGTPPAVLQIDTDITERAGLEDRLRQAQKLEAVGRLAGGVAHDFNNLLTVIGGYARLASDLVGDASGAAELAEIERAARRAADLTSQLLAFSRREVPEPADVDLAAAVRSVVPMLRRLIGEDVEIAVHTEDVPPVRVDRSQMEQVIVNLAVNARDAMPAGGTLTIEVAAAARDAGDVMLAVTDTGTGFAPGVAEHLFEPFFTTKEVGAGTGLGLAMVHGVATEAGGEVTARARPGGGARFEVHLPAAGAAPPALFVHPPAPPPPRAAAPSPAGATVLVCEDEEPVRALLERILRRHGCVVLSASRPEEALRDADRLGGRLDLLVSDILMPGMAGTELARRLRSDRPDLPVLFVSGHAREALDAVGGLPTGSILLGKPFEVDDLLAAIGGLLAPPGS